MKVNVNGITINYEKLGEGAPIVFLHGNGESLKLFRKTAKILASTFTCYLLDSRCHGKSTKHVPLTYDDMALDVIAFIRELDIVQPALFGFSDGGIVGLIIAMKEPQLLSHLIAAGANITPDGLTDNFRKSINLLYRLTHSSKMNLMLTQPQIQSEHLSAIVTPTLLTAGERDIVREKHSRLIEHSIPNCRLTIYKGCTHSSYVTNAKKLTALIMGELMQISN